MSLLFVSLLSCLSILIGSIIIGAPRHVRVICLFITLTEVLAIFPRALVLSMGIDTFKGPGDLHWITPALQEIVAYNLSFLFGLLCGHFQAIGISARKGVSQVSGRVIGRKSIMLSALICAAPGVMVLLFGPHHTFLNDENISNDRVAGAGLGPLILLKEVPLTALILWYAYQGGKVGKLWWTAISGMIVLSLLGGNRSQALTFIVILAALRLMNGKKKVKGRTVVALSGLGLSLVYVGVIVSYARKMMDLYGGSFFMWARQIVQLSPLKAFLNLQRSSFNGFDGLVSVIGTVPSAFPHYPGRLWFEFATILIPRSIWTGKWTTDLALQFTHAVWGWAPGQGANFLTGVGAMYLDGGITDVILGAVFLGIITGLIGCSRLKSSKNQYVARSLAAIWCYFLVRFTYAGGSPDAVMAERVAVEFLIVVLIAKIIDRKNTVTDVWWDHDYINEVPNVVEVDTKILQEGSSSFYRDFSVKSLLNNKKEASINRKI